MKTPLQAAVIANRPYDFCLSVCFAA